MCDLRRSHPAYRAAGVVARLVGRPFRSARVIKRLCWVTHRGGSVTRLTRTHRGTTRRAYTRGDAWGVVRAGW